MNLSFKLFKFQGVYVNLKLLFLILFLFIPFNYVIAIFIAVLVHELSHAFWANKLHYRVYSIYIDAFSGGCQMDNNIPESDSIKIAAAGPLSNLILGSFSFGVYTISTLYGFPIKFLYDMFFVNMLLFIFNILPIKPMDGGQILRDYLLRKMRRNRRKAIDISNYISFGCSLLLLLFAITMSYLILGVFAVVFMYTSAKEIGWTKKYEKKLGL